MQHTSLHKNGSNANLSRLCTLLLVMGTKVLDVTSADILYCITEYKFEDF
jgi:hypothetical protein